MAAYLKQQDLLIYTFIEAVPLKGSEITFFKNGVSQGTAFTDVLGGTYYPAASMYMGAEVKFNFGPDFKYTPGTSLRPNLDLLRTPD